MRFSYNWLQTFFSKRLPNPDTLAKQLNEKVFEVEDVERVGSDFVLHIDVLPNRPDCYSHLGIAREISAITGLTLTPLPMKYREEKVKSSQFIQVKVSSGCKRYCGKIFLDLEIKESPSWIKERLEVCGIRPINNIVDIANYVMLELGQPLHAFDLEKIRGKRINVRFARRGEKIVTLDGEVYELNGDILVIADAKEPIAIAGIKGGKTTGVSETTKMVFLESATFRSETIRRGSRKIDLRTDASIRFEHGVDTSMAELAIKRASSLIQEICNAKIAKGIIDVGQNRESGTKIVLDPDYTKSLLGEEISLNEQNSILRRLQIHTKIKNGKIYCTIPHFRLDLRIQEDLIEEIGRIYGLERIKPVMPLTMKIPVKKNFEIFWENFIRERMKEMGFSETINYTFLSKDLISRTGFSVKEAVEIVNPVSLEFQFLRPSLLPGLLKNVVKNLIEFKRIRLFEIGKIFKRWNSKIFEKKQLGGVIADGQFIELKGVVETLISQMGITNCWFDSYKPTPEQSHHSFWHLKKSAEIKFGNEEVGFLGEVSGQVLKNLKINKQIFAFEIDLEKIIKLATEEVEFKPISIYPAILRDISVWVPLNTLVDEVLGKIESSNINVIEDIDLIDIFEDEEEFRKSLTFRIVFRAKDRAITTQEVDKILENLFSLLQENPTWEVRK